MLLDSALPAINARVGGDILLLLAPNTQARFEIVNGAEEIQVDISSSKQQISAKHFILVVGAEGGSQGNLRAGGGVRISDQLDSWQPDTRDHFSMLEGRIAERIRSRLQAANISAEMTDRRVQDALRHAEERIAAAMQKMESQGFGKGGFVPSRPPVPPIPPIPPVRSDREPAVEAAPAAQETVTDEERLLILRMLQEKKISVEEAEALMDALESSVEE